jgi:TRAP-type C4-dicarboxylate transport system substrate-binding protein
VNDARRRATLAVALVIVVAGCSGSHAARHPAASAHYADAVGDGRGGADIRSIDVTSTKAGRISFRVRLDNLPPSGTVVDLWLDTDADPDTGNATFTGAGGAEYLFSAFLGTKPPPDCTATGTGTGWCLARFSPGGWVPAQAPTATVSRSATGFTASIDRRDLGNTREFNFHVDRADRDRAPGGIATFNYSLALGGPKPETSSASGNEPADKAGARANQGPTVLTLATHDYNDPAVETFVAAVKRHAGGSIRIDVKSGWRYYDLASEQGTISDVRHGAADLVSVGARAWDTVGVKSFRAVVAPFLVDSDALQGDVLESPLAQRMLDGVRPLGLVGIALLPGELRRPLGVSRTLLRPRDFRGGTIGIRPGGVARNTFRALGASAEPTPSDPSKIVLLDGAEIGVPSIVNNRYDLRARALTSNVVLWPRATTIVMNEKSYDALSSDQQDALKKAGREAVAPLVSYYESYERDQLTSLCRLGRLPLVAASAADRAALTRAVQPVYHHLERDSLTRDLISEIRSLRATLPPAEPLRCRTAPAGATRSPLEGRWHAEISPGELRALGVSPDEIARSRGAWTLVLGHGRWVATRETPPGGFLKGTYTVDGQTFREIVESCSSSTHCTPGNLGEYRWSVYRNKLSFTRLPGRFGSTELVAKPWTQEH